jgi:tetratricopeptide (TPR) repeat protein
MSEREIQRWSREVAEDPGAPSFLRLARAYRKQGRSEAARDLVESGLAANPEHVAAHTFLAVIHLDAGDHERARDEWETALSLDADSFASLRGLGFLALERNDLTAARRHLERAAQLRPYDPTVAEARQIVALRSVAAAQRPAGGPDPATAAAPDPAPVPAAARESRSGAQLFEPLEDEVAFMGGLVLDDEGRPLAGAMSPSDNGAGELLGALLNGVGEEAERTTDLLGIGRWDRLLIEGEGAILHASSLPSGGMLLLAARPGTPAGWVIRLSERARPLALRFMEEAP